VDDYEDEGAKASNKPTPEDPRKAKTARAKYKLAERLEDNEMLIASIRFSCQLEPDKPTPAGPIDDFIHTKPKRLRKYVKAARLVLGIRYLMPARTLRLPQNYLRVRLRNVGLRLWINPSQRDKFEQLNTNLEIDDAMKAFAAAHPILEKVKFFLKGDYIPPAEELLGTGPPHKIKKKAAQVASPPPEAPEYNSLGAMLHRQNLSRDGLS